MEAMPLSLGVLADAIENSPFCGKNNAKVHPILAKMLRSTPELFDVQADPSLTTAELQIQDREVFTREYNEHLRCHEEDRRDRKAEKCSSKCSTDVATKTTKEKGFLDIDRLIQNHHERIALRPHPKYRFVIKCHFDDGAVPCQFEICGKDADSNKSDVQESHDVLYKSDEPSSAGILGGKRKLSSPASQHPKRPSSEESSGYESQEPGNSEDLFSWQRAGIGLWTPFIEVAQTGEVVQSDESGFYLQHNSVDSGIETAENDVQEIAPKDASPTLSDMLHSMVNGVTDSELLKELSASEVKEFFSAAEESLSAVETGAGSAEKKDNTSVCYIMPNVSSLQGDHVTVVCSALQEDTTYWVAFSDEIWRIEAVCKISCGQPCLEIKAPPKEQPGAVIVTIQDLSGQEINDYPLTLTYVSEKKRSYEILSDRRRYWDVSFSKSKSFVSMDIMKFVAIMKPPLSYNIKKFTSSVVKKIERSYTLDDAMIATCKVLCHASAGAFKDSGIFGVCEVESSECRRSAAILGIEPSPSKVIQNIVKTAIEESRDSFYEVMLNKLMISNADYEERQQLRLRRKKIKRAGAGKGTRRLEHEQRRQRRVERMKRTGKAGKTGQQI